MPASSVNVSSDASTTKHTVRHDQIAAVMSCQGARTLARRRVVDVEAEGERISAS